MSYTFVQDTGEESLVECFSDIPAGLRSKSASIDEWCYCKGSETESFQNSQSGTISKHSTEIPGIELLKSFVRDGPAMTSAQPERCLVSTALKVDFGDTCRESLAKYDHHTCSWKTPLQSLFLDFSEFSGTWPRWGTMLDGRLLAGQTP